MFCSLTKFAVLVLVLTLISLPCGRAARILGFFPTPSKSHIIIHMSVARALAERGHDVTVVTTIPLTETSPSIRHIKLNAAEFSRDMVKNLTHTQARGFQFLRQMFTFASSLLEMNDKVLKDPELQKLMKEKQFDIVLLGYFLNDFHIGLAAHFKCPVVVIWMSNPLGMINQFVGNPPEISYVPASFFVEKQPLNFWGRLTNFFYGVFDQVIINVARMAMTSYYEANFDPKNYPPFDEITKNISLVLANHHFTQGPIRPNVPAMIEIGGIQVKSKPDPLPEDIKTVLDSASDTGAIYFSLGSNVFSSDLPSNTIEIIFRVLSSLKQKVLWKWENSHLPGNATNIHYKEWYPQDDILAHRNVKLFITHGGKGGITESEYHGVPMLAVPLFGDQEANAKLMTASGFGLDLELQTLTEDNFRKTILELLNNAKYRDKVKKFSELYKDRPQTAKETAVFWVEYVMRHRGASHMQSPYVHLNFIQRNGLDVLGFLGLIVYISIKVLVLCLKFLFHKLCRRSLQSKKKKE